VVVVGVVEVDLAVEVGVVEVVVGVVMQEV
jgi:hypothetical protein